MDRKAGCGTFTGAVFLGAGIFHIVLMAALEDYGPRISVTTRQVMHIIHIRLTLLGTWAAYANACKQTRLKGTTCFSL